MNHSLFHLSVKTLSSSPFYTKSGYAGFSSLTFSRINAIKQFSHFYYSNNPNIVINFQSSKFIKSLSTPIHISSLQIFTKTQFVKRNQTKFSVTDCQFVECRSTEDNEGGGAIHIEHTPNIQISKSSFIACASIISHENGGAIYIKGVVSEANLQSNCFIQCSASRNGHAFSVHSNKCLFKQNFTSVMKCPVFYKKKQMAALYVKSDMLCSDVNITKCDAMFCPIFSFSTGKNSYNKYYSLENNTAGKSYILFSFASKASANPSVFDMWNVKFNDYKNRMQFEVKEHSIINSVFVGGDQDYMFEMHSGSISFINCRCEKVVKFELTTEKSSYYITRLHTQHVYPIKNITFIDIPKINDKGCQVTISQNLDDEKLPIAQIAQLVATIVTGLVVAVIGGFCASITKRPNIRRDDEEALRPRGSQNV